MPSFERVIETQYPSLIDSRSNIIKHSTVILRPLDSRESGLSLGQQGAVKTREAIAQPESRQNLKQELNNCELLGKTKDGKKIYLFHYQSDNSIMREIGRLREITARVVGGGTGKKRDIDKCDPNYWHLVLWDEAELEIVGACRMTDTNMILSPAGLDSIYTSSLFIYNRAMKPYLYRGLELGRSFIQPRYRAKRTETYLWHAIGSLIRRNPQYRYVFGMARISNRYSQAARDLLVYFYTLYFGVEEKPVTALYPYQIDRRLRNKLKLEFKGNNYNSDFKQLKSMLDMLGFSIPAVYRQSAEACEKDGVIFSDFNVGSCSSDCVDGFMIIDTEKLKVNKRRHYIRK